MRLQFNHADLVANRAASIDGSNLQVFVSDGAGEREIDRVLDPGSRWNEAQTQIWFALDADISGGQTQDRRYYLVIHPTVTSPSADPSQVFLVYDQFEGSTLDNAVWALSEKTDGPGSHNMQVSGGELVLTATASGMGMRAQSVRTVSNWQLDAIAIDAAVRTNSNLGGGGSNCTQEFLTGFWSPSPSTYIRSLFFHDRSGYRFANHRDAEPYDFRVQNSGTILSVGTTRRYSMRWRALDVELVADETSMGTFNTEVSTFTRPLAGPLIAGFEAVALGGCPGVESHLAVDWVMIRKTGRAEPALRLQLGQATQRDL